MPAINRCCPRSGRPVAHDSLTTYREHVVGFCNPHCRDDFAAHAGERPRDRAYFDAVIAGHAARSADMPLIERLHLCGTDPDASRRSHRAALSMLGGGGETEETATQPVAPTPWTDRAEGEHARILLAVQARSRGEVDRVPAAALDPERQRCRGRVPGPSGTRGCAARPGALPVMNRRKRFLSARESARAIACAGAWVRLRRAAAGALLACASATALAGYPTPDAAVDALWAALSHEAGAAPETAALDALFDDRAVIFGSRQGHRGPELTRQDKGEFIRRLQAPRAYRFTECETGRTVSVQDRFAAVESRVTSVRAGPDVSATFVGVNSIQLYRAERGWTIVSLYYHVLPAEPASTAHDPSSCERAGS